MSVSRLIFLFVLFIPLSVNANKMSLQQIFNQHVFSAPVFLVQAPGDNNWFYLVEQAGVIKRFKADGSSLSRYIDIRERVNSGGERGLLGFAFDPEFPQRPVVYLSYTTRVDRKLLSRISRFSLEPGATSVNTESEEVLLEVAQPYGNHNGGQIAFGPDGYLYIGLGDGGSAGDPKNHGQNRKTLLGALLRLDVTGTSGYALPADNPFLNDADARGEIYAWGLRNPWRWSFDRKTSQLWLADVGQNAWEEINLVAAGSNYGWNTREGRHCYKSRVCSKEGLTDPVYEYSHKQGQSITGGYVYRGSRYPQWQGNYFFADFVAGKIWSINTDNKVISGKADLQWQGQLNISSFAEDNAGELYVLDYAQGKVYRLNPR